MSSKDKKKKKENSNDTNSKPNKYNKITEDYSEKRLLYPKTKRRKKKTQMITIQNLIIMKN